MQALIFSTVMFCFLAGCGGGSGSTSAITGIETTPAAQAVSAN